MEAPAGRTSCPVRMPDTSLQVCSASLTRLPRRPNIRHPWARQLRSAEACPGRSPATGENVPLDLVLAIDISGSMEAVMAEVGRASTRFVARLRPQDSATVLAFNDNRFLVVDTERDPVARRTALSKLEPWGGTALYDAVAESLELAARSPGRKGVVAFSDGEDWATRRLLPRPLRDGGDRQDARRARADEASGRQSFSGRDARAEAGPVVAGRLTARLAVMAPRSAFPAFSIAAFRHFRFTTAAPPTPAPSSPVRLPSALARLPRGSSAR